MKLLGLDNPSFTLPLLTLAFTVVGGPMDLFLKFIWGFELLTCFVSSLFYQKSLCRLCVVNWVNRLTQGGSHPWYVPNYLFSKLIVDI